MQTFDLSALLAAVPTKVLQPKTIQMPLAAQGVCGQPLNVASDCSLFSLCLFTAGVWKKLPLGPTQFCAHFNLAHQPFPGALLWVRGWVLSQGTQSFFRLLPALQELPGSLALLSDPPLLELTGPAGVA